MSDASERAWVLIPAGQRASGDWIDDTLAARTREAGLEARAPLAGCFPRSRVEAVPARDTDAFVDALYSARGWTDGLPVVPPTPARVLRMLQGTTRAPDEVLAFCDEYAAQLSPLTRREALKVITRRRAM